MTSKHLFALALLISTLTSSGVLEAQAIHPQYSPDGEWLTWYQRIDNRAVIHRAKPDATEHEILIDDGGWYANPSFVPGSNRLALAAAPRGMSGTWNLFTIDLVTGERCQLTDTDGREMHANASPDGNLIAFVRMTDGTSDVWLSDLEGHQTRLTESPGREFHPKWSPDGRRIVYDHTDDASTTLRVVNVETGVIMSVAAAQAPAFTPDWIDAETIVYAAPDGEGRSNLFMVGLDGSTPVRLTDLDGMAGAPFVSPDGTEIAFHSDHEGTYHIYVMTRSTGAIRRISP